MDIYMLTSPSGKSYVGQTKNLSSRMRSYKNINCKCQTHLYHALKKYGFESFKVEILHSDLTINEANKLEVKEIADRGCVANGYNIQHGGCGVGTMSEETKQKISTWHKGKVVSEETKQKIRDIRTGSKASEEARKNMSLAKKGVPMPYGHALSVSIARGSKPFHIIKDGVKLGEYAIIRQCARDYDLNSSTISKCLRNIYPQHKGYSFKHIEVK